MKKVIFGFIFLASLSSFASYDNEQECYEEIKAQLVQMTSPDKIESEIISVLNRVHKSERAAENPSKEEKIEHVARSFREDYWTRTEDIRINILNLASNYCSSMNSYKKHLQKAENLETDLRNQ